MLENPSACERYSEKCLAATATAGAVVVVGIFVVFVPQSTEHKIQSADSEQRQQR